MSEKKNFLYKQTRVKALEAVPTALSSRRKERSLSSLVVSKPRVSTQTNMTGKRSRLASRKKSCGRRFHVLYYYRSGAFVVHGCDPFSYCSVETTQLSFGRSEILGLDNVIEGRGALHCYFLARRCMDPGMVDPSAFMVDPSPVNLAVDPTKLVGFVPLVDALLLSNPKPNLQPVMVQGIWFQCISRTSMKGPSSGLYDTDGTSVSSSSVDLYSVKKITSVIK
nr:hypothetical protein [Tanacetum cinerariifolium]